jgi:filamin
MSEGEPIKVDRTWVDVQKKTFTRWCNQFLAERRLKIDNLDTDLKTGINLCSLLEIISSKTIGKWNQKPTTRYQFLENNGIAIKFIKDEGLQLVGIGPEDVVDGKTKLILGLIWTLILRYQINVIGEGSPKWELLEWVRKQIAPYDVPQKPLRNFTTDWQDGKVISALVDSLKPGVLTPTNLSALSGSPLADTEKACNTALREYEIPILMDPEDMVNTPDELSLMTYVAAFRNWASDEARRQREELERKKRTADPATCYAYGPGLEAAETFTPAHFTIVAKNCFDEELSAGGDVFDVTVNGPDGSVTPKVTDNGNGKYPVEYTVTKGGDYTIGIKLRGQDIKGSPYHVHASGPKAGNSYATGPGVEGGARVGQDAPFRIHSVDAAGKPVKHGGDPYQVQVQGPEDVADPKLKDNGDGTFDGAYKVSKPGYYFVNITLHDEPIKGAPFKVLVENANAGQSYAEGPGLEGGQTGKPAKFKIFAVDPDGKPVKKGGDPFEVQIDGPGGVKPTVTDNGDGTYDVQYDPTKPGDYHVNVTLHDQPIKDMPKKVHIKPSPNAGNSYATGPALKGLVDNEPGEFTIHAVDADGKPRTDGGDNFDVKINGPQGPVKPDVTDNGDGTYDVKFDPSEPGPYDISVDLEGQPIKDSPWKVKCKEGTDASKCGFGIFSFTLQSRDKRGNNKTFGGDDFQVKITGPSGSEVESKTKDNGDGTYTAVYALTGKKGDTFRIRAELNGKKAGTFRQDLRFGHQ